MICCVGGSLVHLFDGAAEQVGKAVEARFAVDDLAEVLPGQWRKTIKLVGMFF